MGFNHFELWEKKDEETFLLKKLNHYTKKNTYDFFIHKNLKGFLQHELDYYIKSELVNVDVLYVQETETHFERIKHNLKTIKIFKNIADTIIDFLSQIEEFQKKLWEKKKFVLSTEWIITIDRLVSWIGKKESEEILKEVLKNPEQIGEWKELFGEEILERWESIKLSDLSFSPSQDELDKTEEELKIWMKLPIDTIHFSEDFKLNLLNLLSDNIDIEKNCDGLVIHSDNYHGNKILSSKFHSLIDALHIDPPYNTNSSGFLYKNNYRESSWLSLMDNRIETTYDLLSANGSFVCHIDEYEYESLYHLIKNKNYSYLATVIWDKKNPMMGGKGIATQHEYLIWALCKQNKIEYQSKNISIILDKSKEIIKKHKGIKS